MAVLPRILLPLTLLLPSCVSTDDDATSPGPEQDASLSSLTITNRATQSALELTPTFSPDVTEYRASAPTGNILDVSGTTTEPLFIVVVNGSQVDATSERAFGPDERREVKSPATLTIGVTANDGMTTRRYTVEVVDPDRDASLAALSLVDESTGMTRALSPDFDSETTAYTATVLGDITVAVRGMASQPNATVTVNGNAVSNAFDVTGLAAPLAITIEVTAIDGMTTSTYQVDVQLGGYSMLAAGGKHTCAVRGNQTVACWGGGDRVEDCFSFSATHCGQSLVVDGLYTQVATGQLHTCALRTDGTVACWGAGTEAIGPCTENCRQAIPPAGTFTQITAGLHHTCGLEMDGTIECWGSDTRGQSAVPAGTYRKVVAGWAHTCALRTDQTVVCWGGQDDAIRMVPAGQFTDIETGEFHGCAVAMDQTIQCWGYNDRGQLDAPAGPFVSVAAGGMHSCGVRTDGTVACWGAGDAPGCNEGACGQATPPAGTFSALSAGQAHTCGIDTQGDMVCWGENEAGQTNAP